MKIISSIILIFSLLGALDLIFGNKFGLGGEFKKGFELFCPMVLSMVGMLVLAPALGVWLTPLFDKFYDVLHIDPSIIPSSLFANDMGGASLSLQVCKTESIGGFCAYIVSSMMGATISFTIPFALGVVKKEQHSDLFFGLLCGIVTIPVGCFVAGLICKIPPALLILTLLPLIVFCVLVALLLIFCTKVCVKIFMSFAIFIKTLSLVVLALSIFTFVTDIQIIKEFDSFQNAVFVCVKASVTLSGALPLMFALSKLLAKPIKKLGSKIGIDSVSALALLSTFVTNATTFALMEKMNKKGSVLTSALCVSGAFMLGSHLAFTMALDQNYTLPMLVGKFVSGVCAVVLANLIYKESATN